MSQREIYTRKDYERDPAQAQSFKSVDPRTDGPTRSARLVNETRKARTFTIAEMPYHSHGVIIAPQQANSYLGALVVKGVTTSDPHVTVIEPAEAAHRAFVGQVISGPEFLVQLVEVTAVHFVETEPAALPPLKGE